MLSLTKTAPEISGSFTCFIMLLVMARVSRYWVRLGILSVVGLWGVYNENWFISMFLFGMAFADYDAEMRLYGTPSMDIYFAKHGRVRTLWKTTWTSALVAGVYMSGNHMDYFRANSGIWRMCFTGCLTFSAIYHLSDVRSVFETSVLQYLSKLSFGIYLCHMTVIDELSCYLRPLLARICAGRTLCIIPLLLGFEISITLILALCFETLIDLPCIRFSHWVESLVVDSDDSSEVIPNLTLK